MSNTDELRDDLARVLDRAERWLKDLGETRDIPEDVSDLAADVRTVHGQRTRAMSALLNVGLLGRFSSGKSFLISGLQGGLEYRLVADGRGGLADKYIGILPFAPTTTTACPSTVVPVGNDSSIDASGRGLLRVKFIDSADSEWVDIGTNQPPAVVQAYGAADGDMTNRRREHWDLEVAQIEIWISKAALPVKLYDLPGAEAANASHEAIMRNAWAKADCFIYVSQATAALSATELELIRDLYNHHLQSGKRVLWVLTGIDRAADLDHGDRPLWQATVDQNNAYLRDHFGASADRPDTFIGEGFIAVSAALEAKADHQSAQGEAGTARRLRTDSRMEGLRDRLTAMIEEGAGQRHLARIADEARGIVRRRRLPIADVLATHRVPVEELEGQRADVSRRLDRINDSTDRVRFLDAELKQHIRAAERSFGGLGKILHQELDAVIRAGNLGPEHTNEIDVRCANIFKAWMTDAEGPATILQREMDEFEAKARAFLRQELGGYEPASRLVVPEPLDLDLFLSSTAPRRRVDAHTLMNTAAAAATAVGVAGGTLTWMMSSLAALVAVPVTATVTAAGIGVVAVKFVKDQKSAIEKARTERIAKLTVQAEQARAQFNNIAERQGQIIIDAVGEHLGEHRSRLQATLRQISERIGHPDIVKSHDLVAHLDPFDREAQQIIIELLRFSRHRTGLEDLPQL